MECEDYLEYPRPVNLCRSAPSNQTNQIPKINTNLALTNPTGMMGVGTNSVGMMGPGMNPMGMMGQGMNPLGMMGMGSGMNPMGMIASGMNPMGMGMNPMGMMGINPMAAMCQMGSQMNPFQFQGEPKQMEINSNDVRNNMNMMIQHQYQQQMLMMSMTFNPMMMGGFNPYGGMLNPAMMQQQQQWMNSRNRSNVNPPPVSQPQEQDSSDGELPDSDESESDSGSANGSRKRMALPRNTESLPAPTSPQTVREQAKLMKIEYNSEDMDTDFRNPNAVTKNESPDTLTDTVSLVASTSTEGNEKKNVVSASTDVYTNKLKDYRSKVGSKNAQIWSQLATAEGVEETAQMFDVVSMVDTFSILRGPETYVVGKRRKRKLPVDGDNSGKTKENEDNYESDSSISSGGLSDDTNKDLKERYAARTSTSAIRRISKVKNTKNKPKNGAEVHLAAMDEEVVPEVKVKQRAPGRAIMEEKMAEMLDYKAAFYIANKLKETKKHLFSNTMKLLGRETTIKLFFKTLKIERLGGMMIKNKSRRRTPGGVFLYLVRNDSRLPKETIGEIFKTERENRKLEKRKCTEMNKKKWLNKLAEKVSIKLGSTDMKVEESAPVDSDAEAEDVESSYDIPAAIVQPEANANVTEDQVLPPRQITYYDDIPDEYLCLTVDRTEYDHLIELPIPTVFHDA